MYLSRTLPMPRKRVVKPEPVTNNLVYGTRRCEAEIPSFLAERLRQSNPAPSSWMLNHDKDSMKRVQRPYDHTSTRQLPPLTSVRFHPLPRIYTSSGFIKPGPSTIELDLNTSVVTIILLKLWSSPTLLLLEPGLPGAESGSISRHRLRSCRRRMMVATGMRMRMAMIAATMPMMAVGLKPSLETKRCEGAARGAGGVDGVDVAGLTRVVSHERYARVDAIAIFLLGEECIGRQMLCFRLEENVSVGRCFVFAWKRMYRSADTVDGDTEGLIDHEN